MELTSLVGFIVGLFVGLIVGSVVVGASVVGFIVGFLMRRDVLLKVHIMVVCVYRKMYKDLYFRTKSNL